MVFFLVEKSAIGISTVLSKVNTNFLAALKFFFSHLIPMCNSFFLFWVLPRELTGHSKHPLPTTQDKTLHMDITRWSILKSDCLYSFQPKMEKLYTVSKNKTRS